MRLLLMFLAGWVARSALLRNVEEKNPTKVTVLVIVVAAILAAFSISNAAATDPGFAIANAKGDQLSVIFAAYNELSPCERLPVDHSLTIVTFVPAAKIDDDWGVTDSYTYIEIDESLHGDTLKRIFFHEIGHFFDHGKSQRASFKAAVTDDYAGETPASKVTNDYLKRPSEAFAELFAYEHMQKTYAASNGAYAIERLIKSYAEAVSIHRETCGE